ncbi:serine/threonine-protein kinase RsbW [Amycolatopsis sulphurea]|uniref:Serine/threonine-protein kinase RsbW n=2 Tax=Amycolatopsis sulphurea TaxID=76022 RepID=A0A2A9G3Q8_9PSEU|nr:serine/threonine-protein kinase RsbW [Amycolatopsis sulphurea]
MGPATKVVPAFVPMVELRLPADRDLLFLARMVAEGLAGTGEFSLDEIADLRLAVEEAVSVIALRADDGAEVECVFRHDSRITVTMATSSSAMLPPGPDEVGWHILRALTDSVATWTEPGPDPHGWRLCLEFTKEPRTGGP